MDKVQYHERIVRYYKSTEHAYRDSWDLDNSLAIHYGYYDEKVSSFPQSLIRMNEVMAEAAGIRVGELVLDAGCGVGGSSIFLAKNIKCRVKGITLSSRQVELAVANAKKNNLDDRVEFLQMDYCNTSFADNSFDVVWGCESICYADTKEDFTREAYRILKPGGRLIVADGFVSDYKNNDHPVIRKWLDGWQVNYLETMERFSGFMQNAGFKNITARDITKYTKHSSARLYRFYFLAKIYVFLRRLFFSKSPTPEQAGNISACKYQYKGMKKGLWKYGIVVGEKLDGRS